MLRRTSLSVAALAAAALLLESTLTRLLAVAQYYHFAFLVVSLALLGFGASGTFLSLRKSPAPSPHIYRLAGAGFAASTLLVYAAVNWLPFDSYTIAWERRQLVYFGLYYLVLTLPFFCSGVGIGAGLAIGGGRGHLIYAANLLGSAVGVLLALIALALAGVPGAVLASALIGVLPALIGPVGASQSSRHPLSQWLAVVVLVIGAAGFGALAVLNAQARAPLGLVISPYKGLAYALRYPGAATVFGKWNAISRADVIADAGTRLLPGLSYTFTGAPPLQAGLSLDADSPQPVTLIPAEAFAAADYLPEAIAFGLRSGGRSLVLEPGGGLGVLQALVATPNLSGQLVTAVISNPLVREAVGRAAPSADVYADPRVETVIESPRVYLRQPGPTYDVIFLPLTDAYRPISSGAYGLGETYGLTVEAFADALARLAPDGMLVATRWLQTPPSESVRLIATLVEALAQRGVAHPSDALVAYRGIQTITALVQPDGWSAEELVAVREFTAARHYDLIWAPDVRDDEVNRFNRLPEPADFQAVAALLAAQDRRAFYAGYPFDVAPATDDHPFFYHFFKWRQTPEVLATLGRTWQPFGGSGYLVLWALLALVTVLSALLIVAPLALRRAAQPAALAEGQPGVARGRVFAYFGLLGLAFLFVEIPLIQRWILLLGHATYAFAAVVLSLLLFSGLGSLLARAAWLLRRAAWALLVLLALLTPLVTVRLADAALGWPPWVRAGVAVISLAPLGVLMGLPFPRGVAWLEDGAPRLIPWAWAVNGAASVVASVLAAILALSSGFTVVLLLGAGCYAAAGIVLSRSERRASQ
jgi:spermidine synthase